MFLVKRHTPTVYLVNNDGELEGQEFFDHDQRHGGVFSTVAARLAEMGYTLCCLNSQRRPPRGSTVVLFQNMPSLDHLRRYRKRYKKEQLFLFQWEPPVVQPQGYIAKHHQYFQRVYMRRDDVLDAPHYGYFFYPVPCTQVEPLPFDQRKLLTFIYANKSSLQCGELYTERRKVVNYFETLLGSDFEFYGVGWPKEQFRYYRGSPENKVATLSQYRFSICYENVVMSGHITEKIIDCFMARCVPIYLGAPNIDQYIPKTCYIDRCNFKDETELHAHLKAMSEEEHASYLHAIEQFLQSASAKRFSPSYFAELIASLLPRTSSLKV